MVILIGKVNECNSVTLLCHSAQKNNAFRIILSIGFIFRLKSFWYFRSPWSNAYDPPLDDGAMPSDRLRRLEIDANAAFDQYREL